MKIKKITKGLNALIVSAIIITTITTSGCKPGNRKQTNETESNGSSVSIEYAKGFTIHKEEEYTKVVINNPWGNGSKPYETYYLYKSDSTELPQDGIKVKTPISSIVINTFSYFEFLKQFDELDKVVGVSDAERVYNQYILEKLSMGEIQDLGDPFNPNLEKSLMLRADAVVTSAYAQQDTYNERLKNTGVPIIYSLEWMEETPLARAEWIKMIAEFFDKADLAADIFDGIKHRYISNKELVNRIEGKQPSILAGDNFQGTWYLPGGGSFNATLFRDAGIDYFYKNDKQQGSIGLDIETILTQFATANIWFGCEADSYKELENKDRKYMLLDAVKNKTVYSNRNRTTLKGGNDYFEGAVANPDLLLRDLIKIAHPGLFTDSELTYLKPLN
mgnify:CR=1 FL=1